ncbi:basic salivary proline-rich protein 4-like [Lepus europaeus]|uniref:basic salivary proline-rich protein 4-like n=1 Tax=Lepus europaeus TaxID=9983 RepID=UPI002B49D545|nr:basic salivary proline-rich protein 4-like [Lepus europaeus]
MVSTSGTLETAKPDKSDCQAGLAAGPTRAPAPPASQAPPPTLSPLGRACPTVNEIDFRVSPSSQKARAREPPGHAPCQPRTPTPGAQDAVPPPRTHPAETLRQPPPLPRGPEPRPARRGRAWPPPSPTARAHAGPAHNRRPRGWGEGRARVPTAGSFCVNQGLRGLAGGEAGGRPARPAAALLSHTDWRAPGRPRSRGRGAALPAHRKSGRPAAEETQLGAAETRRPPQPQGGHGLRPRTRQEPPGPASAHPATPPTPPPQTPERLCATPRQPPRGRAPRRLTEDSARPRARRAPPALRPAPPRRDAEAARRALTRRRPRPARPRGLLSEGG